MYSHILIPVALDHEHPTEPALALARRLLASDGRITALHVMEPVAPYISQYLSEEQLRDRPENARHHVREAFGAEDVAVALVEGHAGNGIVEFAGGHDVDLIVIASHRPNLQDYFLGSTAGRVVRHAQCSVHVLR